MARFESRVVIKGSDGNTYCWDHVRKLWVMVVDIPAGKIPRDVVESALDKLEEFIAGKEQK